MRSCALLLLAAPLAACAAAAGPCDDLPRPADATQKPETVFPAFQLYVRCGQYKYAHTLLTPDTHKLLNWEQFYFGLTAFEALRRLILSTEVHAHDLKNGRVRLCSPEFGIGRDFRVASTKIGAKSFYLLDFTGDDVEYLKGRALGWHRLQVRKADGWHFAYPPDWTYAPLARTCPCGS